MDKTKEYRKQYYLKNKAIFKEYYLKNRDVLLARSIEWNKNNRDSKEYYKQNREAILARTKKWNDSHSKLKNKKKRLNLMLKKNEERVQQFREQLTKGSDALNQEKSVL
jgi:hypothetical protein